MRVFLFLLSLLVAAGAVVLAYFGFTETLTFVQYMLASTALSVVLAFICGHFMHRTWRNRKRAREAEDLADALEDEKRELAAARTSLETKLASQNEFDRPLPPPDMDPEVTQKVMMTPPPTDVVVDPVDATVQMSKED